MGDGNSYSAGSSPQAGNGSGSAPACYPFPGQKNERRNDGGTNPIRPQEWGFRTLGTIAIQPTLRFSLRALRIQPYTFRPAGTR